MAIERSSWLPLIYCLRERESESVRVMRAEVTVDWVFLALCIFTDQTQCFISDFPALRCVQYCTGKKSLYEHTELMCSQGWPWPCCSVIRFSRFIQSFVSVWSKPHQLLFCGENLFEFPRAVGDIFWKNNVRKSVPSATHWWHNWTAQVKLY